MARKYLGVPATSPNDLIRKSELGTTTGNVSGTSVLDLFLSNASVNLQNNPRTRPLYPPELCSVTKTSATLDAEFTSSYKFTDTGHPFTAAGGNPVTVSGYTKFPCYTPTGASPVIGASWKVSFLFDGNDLVIATGVTGKFRLIVEGQYLSKSALSVLGGSGTQYTYVSFAKTSNRPRLVVLEGDLESSFVGTYFGSLDNVLPQATPGIRAIIVGDSNISSLEQEFINDGIVSICGDYLGIQDIWASGVFGTGFLSKNRTDGTSNKYSERRQDWLSNAPDVLMFTGSINDIVIGGTAVDLKAAAIAELAAARAAFPKIPILLYGVLASRVYLDSLGLLPTAIAHETALKEALESFSDPMMGFIPSMLNLGGPPLTGSPGTPGNWDKYVLPDTHLNTAGHEFMGQYISLRMIEGIAKICNVPVPSILPNDAEVRSGFISTGSPPIISSEAPVAAEGKSWINPDSGVMAYSVEIEGGGWTWFVPLGSKGKDGTDGTNGTEIIVSATPPEAPVLNQLWLDTSDSDVSGLPTTLLEHVAVTIRAGGGWPTSVPVWNDDKGTLYGTNEGQVLKVSTSYWLNTFVGVFGSVVDYEVDVGDGAGVRAFTYEQYRAGDPVVGGADYCAVSGVPTGSYTGKVRLKNNVGWSDWRTFTYNIP